MFDAQRENDKITILTHVGVLEILRRVTSPQPVDRGPMPLVKVTGDDPLDHLEAEMIADTVRAGIDSLIATQDHLTRSVITSFTPVDAEVYCVTLTIGEAAAVAATINRSYVLARTREVNRFGTPVSIGEADLLPELAELFGETHETAEMNLETYVYAMVAEMICAALVAH